MLEHIDTWQDTKGATTDRRSHYTDDGVPVRVIVHRDRTYPFQSNARIERWTNDCGYGIVVTASPNDIANDDVGYTETKLIDVYNRVFGGAI